MSRFGQKIPVEKRNAPPAKPARSPGPLVRRVVRRQKADARVAAGQPRSIGKGVKKTQARLRKHISFARWLTSMLIRATGTAAPASVQVVKTGRDAYHQKLYELGTSISKPGWSRGVYHNPEYFV